MYNMLAPSYDPATKAKYLARRETARLTQRLRSVKINKNMNELLLNWAKTRILKLLDMTIRSHILRHTCYMILKHGGEMQTQQLVYQMQEFGYTSADTPYKYVNYINKINLKYDLPISFHYGDGYVRFDITKM